MKIKPSHCGLLVVMSALVSACAAKPTPAPNAPTAQSLTAGVAAPRETPKPATAGVLRVDDAISRACGLPAPRFDFDSTRIEGSAAGALDTIATCFKTGPLAGKKLRLVGHADPRGEFDYNLALGQRRASSVRSYVEARGLSGDKISTTSRGALDAEGKDEAGWARDRRVDMVLAD